MDEDRARRVTDALRDHGIDAHLENAGIDIYGVRVVLSGGPGGGATGSSRPTGSS